MAFAPMSPKTCEVDRWATHPTDMHGGSARVHRRGRLPTRASPPTARPSCGTARLPCWRATGNSNSGVRVRSGVRRACVCACVRACMRECVHTTRRLPACIRAPVDEAFAVRGSASTNPRPRRMLRAAHCVLGCYRCNAHLVANAKACAARANLCAPHGTTGGVLRTLSAGAIRGHQAYSQRPDRASAPRPAL